MLPRSPHWVGCGHKCCAASRSAQRPPRSFDRAERHLGSGHAWDSGWWRRWVESGRSASRKQVRRPLHNSSRLCENSLVTLTGAISMRLRAMWEIIVAGRRQYANQCCGVLMRRRVFTQSARISQLRPTSRARPATCLGGITWARRPGSRGASCQRSCCRRI